MRAAVLLAIAACASPPPTREPAPPEQAPMPPPTAASPAATATVAPAPAPSAAPAPTASAGALLIAMGTPRSDVRAAFGKADPTGPGFDTFGSKGLVIGYHQDLVDTVTATTLAVGTTYRDRVLGVAIGDTVAHANATWGPQVSSEPGNSEYSTATYKTGAYRVTVEIWKADGNRGQDVGTVRAQTIGRIEVTRR